jgi:ATP-dependent Clp protease ATP-binding subunit ClpB
VDINKLTQKSQEALTEAQSIATRMGHIEVDGEHLLMALIDQPEGLRRAPTPRPCARISSAN